MDKTYQHLAFEQKIYSLWEKGNVFVPSKNKTKKHFCIIMPPPNANDPLHIGHARFVAIQDAIIRYKRMKGFSALWLPGSDHAGIETQFVFEKKLLERGEKRMDFDKKTFFAMIWKYVKNQEKTMITQLKKLGSSCDWTRFKFTMDKDIVRLVYKNFKRLYDQGFIYRGERVINYCPRCGTFFSDLEVKTIEKEDSLYFIDYGTITIATVRPETIFADVAVAVNPKDKKNKDLIGKIATVPIINRKVPIIGDSLVDPQFGTGALKVTPYHDPLDFEIAKKHQLTGIFVIDKDGKMINTPPQYLGLKIEEARKKIVKDLQKMGKIKKIERITHTVGVCYRDKTTLEPLATKQWFLKTKKLAALAYQAIKKEKVRFIAKRYEKIALHWLKNLKDWNISRQIVWGIKIPAFKCQDCLSWTITDGKKPKICKKCKGKKLVQDEDTFDTWFSSSMWPFLTLKTTKKGDFNRFYPTSLMNTGYDIIPFWVIRMIMLGLYSTGKVPFEEVLIHGLVRDKFGEKISKSKGNVIDPILMSEKYGADALRMSLIWGSLIENDISLSEENIKAQRNFANKLWNIARFIYMQRKISINKIKKPRPSSKEDILFLKHLEKIIKEVDILYQKYKLNQVAEKLYHFVWEDFANNYLEKAKKRKKETQKILEYTLSQVLKLLHPLMPFITETIWQLGKKNFGKPLLATSSWPK